MSILRAGWFVAPILVLSGCVSAFRALPVSAADGRAMFDALDTCAKKDGYQISRHTDSINVRVKQTWVQFMAQNDQFNLVVLVDPDVAKEHEEDMQDVGLETGNALFACARAAK